MKLYGQKDVDKKALKGARIAILGYGSQGRAHALNLKDSGFDVVVGVAQGRRQLEEGEEGRPRASQRRSTPPRAPTWSRCSTPDLTQEALYDEIEQRLKKNAVLLFAHGFNIHFKQIKPRKDLDVVLIAPKGPGGLVRRQYQEGRGVPCLIAVAQDATGKAHAKALGYAHGIGGTRGGVLDTTFAEETETDLFGEQAVLCGGATELVVKGFETLVEAGYQPEVAYYECLHELKLIVDLLHEGGITKMHKFITRDGQVGRPHLRSARREREDQEGDGQDPQGHPEGQVRQGLDRGEQGRQADLQQAHPAGLRSSRSRKWAPSCVPACPG